MARLALPAVLAALALLAPSAASAAPRPGVVSGTVGVAVPKGATATIRATDVATSTIVQGQDVGRSGRFSLRLPAGAYILRATILPRRAKPIVKGVAVTLKPGQRRPGITLTARRRAKAKAAWVSERGDLNLGSVAIGIYAAKVEATGDLGMLGRGFADLLTTDVVDLVDRRCRGRVTVREVQRMQDLLREFELGESPYADKSTFPKRNLIEVDVAVDTAIAADGRTTITWSDKRSGKQLGSIAADLGDDPFAVETTLAGQLTDSLCKLAPAWQVDLAMTGLGRFATHDASGTMRTTLIARRSGEGVWTGTGQLAWQDVAFSSKIGCPYIDQVVPSVPWTVRITERDQDLEVTWSTQANDAVTASVDCPKEGPDDPDPPPVPGQPGTALLNPAPLAFSMSFAGGVQIISSEVSDGGDGFFTSGTMTIKPLAVEPAA